MATTSYLYHTLGLRHYYHEKTEFLGGNVYYHVHKKKEARRCAHCNARWISMKIHQAASFNGSMVTLNPSFSSRLT